MTVPGGTGRDAPQDRADSGVEGGRDGTGDVDRADRMAVLLGEPHAGVPARAGDDAVGVAAVGQLELREDGAGRVHSADLVPVVLREPDVPVEAGGDSLGRARGRELAE